MMWCCLPCPCCPLLLDVNEEILAPPSAVLLSQDSLCWEILMLVLSSVVQHCYPQITGHQPDPWLVQSFPGDVIWCQWCRSGDSQPEYWRRQSMFYVCQVDIINHSRLCTTCWFVFRGAVCVPTLITVAKWSTASEILFPGIPSSTQRKTTPSRSRPTKISLLLRLVSGCSDCWHCKFDKYVLTFN